MKFSQQISPVKKKYTVLISNHAQRDKVKIQLLLMITRAERHPWPCWVNRTVTNVNHPSIMWVVLCLSWYKRRGTIVPSTSPDTEKWFAVIEKDTIAISRTCETFLDYITGLPFVMETDHTTLLSNMPPRICRFRLQLMKFNPHMPSACSRCIVPCSCW